MRMLNPHAVAAKLDHSLATLQRLRKRDPTFPVALRLTGPRGRPSGPEDAIDVRIAARAGGDERKICLSRLESCGMRNGVTSVIIRHDQRS